MKRKDRFLDHRQQPAPTSTGPMDFPILYRDIGGVTALFVVDAARVEDLLEGTGLVVAPRLPGGKIIAGVAFFTYRDCTIASYNEAALAVTALPAAQAGRLPAMALADLLRPASKRRLGTHILQLPVTTEQARAGGVECYGYPKFVADIGFRIEGSRFFGVTREAGGGADIVRLEGRSRLGLPMRGSDVVTWSMLDKRLLRTEILMDQWLRVAPGHGYTLTVGPSQHPMAQQLQALGLDGAHPFVVMRSDHYRSVLPLGVAQT